MSFIVSFGGGVTSYEALRRTIVKHGRENTVAVFADVGQVRDGQGRVVCGEDEDLHRFMSEVEDLLKVPIQRVKHPEYTDIWDVFFKRRMMGNTRMDPCSAVLKRELLDDWRDARYMPLGDTLVVGLDWTEPDRCRDFAKAVDPWPTWFPLNEPPFVTKSHLCDSLRLEGIEPPRLYDLGFSHNNCGGFCVKMGHEQAYRLWLKLPHVFDYHARREDEFRAFVGQDVSILRDRRAGGKLVMTLRELAKRFEAGYRPKKRMGEGCGGACMMPPKKLEVLA
ncbi:MAG TPA: hypothetical protein VMB21_18655 [Candidatus Limnocylindria bacterium]|nr:hypothetical protein [Candidatus Limnocylindria bacterium]